MSDVWKSYLCRVNGSLASIRFDLGVRGEVPVGSKPWLLWVWLYFKTPRPDGLSASNEAPTLFTIEDALTPELSRRCGAIFCCAITTKGRREFYYYGETRERYREAIAAAMARFQGYEFDAGDKEDPLWEQYLDVLYPSTEDLERIKNRDLLDVLEGKGDVLTVVREVRHWIYFRSAGSRDSFREAAVKLGYKIGSQMDGDGSTPFGLTVLRDQSVEQETADAIVLELLRLAQQFQGEYDGWETPIVTQ
jgi:regulator of RNase E activity RraB